MSLPVKTSLYRLISLLPGSIHDVNTFFTFNNAPDNSSFVDINLTVIN